MKRKLSKMVCLLAAASLLSSGCGAKQEEAAPAEPQTQTQEDNTASEAEPEEEVKEEAAHTIATYNDPNGWSLQYYEDCFEINQQDNVVSFVYTGDSAGTNMLTVTYDISSTDPETIVDGLISDWGEKAVKSEGTFPSDENVPIFRASLPVDESGSGMYMEAIVRSYMEGCLIFELTGHNSGDDELDMGVSDMMAMLIDSVTFTDDSFEAADTAAPINIDGCDTFTQIVDKLEAGKGYTNARIGTEDALLVSSGTYDNGDGVQAAIDAEIFVYLEGAPVSAGSVACGGTAYPLAVKDDMLFVCSGHEIRKYVLSGPDLMAEEGAMEEFDTDGNANYSCFSSDNSEGNDLSQDDCKKRFEELFDEYSKASVLNFATVGGTQAAGSLPAYEYPGPELFYSVLYKYLTDNLGSNYPAGDVCIPCVSISDMDESDKSDIKVYGDFEVYTYNANEDTLECTAGGSHPGVIHVKNTDDGYEVISMEEVADGSDFDESAKKIFGDKYDSFMKIYGNSDEREKTRAQIIANYVAANNLSIKAYKDYGWDPVTLPEENIDSFYSQLD
ncbi:MAG: hypothetical protein K5886_07495 [Lachnospiraceae bacterium]|nr:hypothetical protein [Lachnospiraceae bacterium]